MISPAPLPVLFLPRTVKRAPTQTSEPRSDVASSLPSSAFPTFPSNMELRGAAAFSQRSVQASTKALALLHCRSYCRCYWTHDYNSHALTRLSSSPAPPPGLAHPVAHPPGAAPGTQVRFGKDRRPHTSISSDVLSAYEPGLPLNGKGAARAVPGVWGSPHVPPPANYTVCPPFTVLLSSLTSERGSPENQI